MKKLLSVLLLLGTFSAYTQSLYVPTPTTADSLIHVVNFNKAPRTVYTRDFLISYMRLSKFTTDSAALRALINANTTSIAGKANTTHTHAESDITGLLTDLSGKASLSHTHSGTDIVQSSSYRFTTDPEKATWNAKQSAITTGTTAQYIRGDLSLGTFPTISGTNTGDETTARINALYGYTPANGSLYVPITRTLTINGVTQDWSQSRTYTIATSGSTDSAYIIAQARKAASDTNQANVFNINHAAVSGKVLANLTTSSMVLNRVAAGTKMTLDSTSGLLTFNAITTDKADTSALSQTIDYSIEIVGSTYYARPRFKSGLPLISNIDAYTVIQGAINALTPVGGGSGSGGGHIHLNKGTYSLSNELVINGWESGPNPFSQIVIDGDGWNTVIAQQTSGKNGLVVKNAANFVLRDLRFYAGSAAKSCFRGDTTGVNSELSCYKSVIDNVDFTSNSTTAAAVYISNFFDLTIGVIHATNTTNHAIILENASASTNYGNSHFGYIQALASSSAPYAGLLIRTTHANTFLNMMSFSNYESRVGGYYGIYSDNLKSSTFSFVDIEGAYKSIFFTGSAAGNETRYNTFLGGYVSPATGGTAITNTLYTGGNQFIIGEVDCESTGIPVLDQQQFRPANSYNLTYGFTTTPGNVSIATPSTTAYTVRNSDASITNTLPTGTTATTQAAGTNNTSVATMAAIFAERGSAATLANKTLTKPVITTLPNNDWTATGATLVTAPMVGGRIGQKLVRPKGAKTLSHFGVKSDFYNNGSSGYNAVTSVTTTDGVYDTTASQISFTNTLLSFSPSSVNTVPTDVSNGAIQLTFKIISNFSLSSLSDFTIQLHSSGTPASPTTTFTQSTDYWWVNQYTAASTSGAGRWQTIAMSIKQFKVVNAGAVGGTIASGASGGADLTQIKFATLQLKANSGQTIVVQIGDIQFVPNGLNKAKVIFTFDDGFLSQLTYAAAKMSKYGFRGVLFPSPVGGVIDIDATRLTSKQIKNLHDVLGWQIGSQSWLSEDNTVIDALSEDAFTGELSKLRTWQSSLGLTGGEFGSYFSNVGTSDLVAYPSFRKHFRAMRGYYSGNAATTPMPIGETFPFGDPMLVKALSGSNAYLQSHIDQAISNKGVAIIAWHNELASAGSVRTAFDNLLTYLDSNRANIDVITEDELYSGNAEPSLALTGTPTTPTAATGTNNTQIASTAFTLANQNNDLVRGAQALGSTIKSFTFGFNYSLAGSYAQVSYNGQISLTATVLPTAVTLTGIKTTLSTAGVYTASTGNLVGLYSSNGTTLTLVATSADDGNLWKATAGTMVAKAFTAPYAASAGAYYIATMYNYSAQTTAPALTLINSGYSSLLQNLDFAGTGFVNGTYTTSSTSFPATIAISAVLKGNADPLFMATY